jgi:hypothetical protein
LELQTNPRAFPARKSGAGDGEKDGAGLVVLAVSAARSEKTRLAAARKRGGEAKKSRDHKKKLLFAKKNPRRV